MINENGLSNFRIDTLSENLGYSRQNIYRYFSNKRAILDAVIIEGSRSMAIIIAEQLADNDAPFDEQLIEGVLLACDLIRGDKQLGSYIGTNLSFAAKLFMENAEGVQKALLVFLEPILVEAKKKGELYLHVRFEDITKWLFQIVLSQLLIAEYEDRESRKQFLLKMFSSSVNAKKAKANATIDNIQMNNIG